MYAFDETRELRLQFIAGASAKEYRVAVDPEKRSVTCTWGRIGRIGAGSPSQTFRCASLGAAIDLAESKIDAKVAKGYHALGGWMRVTR